jgi:hypothetical protein
MCSESLICHGSVVAILASVAGPGTHLVYSWEVVTDDVDASP